MQLNTRHMSQAVTTHLLVVSEGSAAANRLISNLRNEGLALRAGHADSEAELGKLLVHAEWDVLACYENSRIPPERVLALLRHHEQALPIIVVTPTETSHDLLSLVRAGIRDVIADADDARLVVSVQREAAQHRLQRQLRRLEVQQHELEKRHRLLLEGSDSAIAYLQDGVHLYCNRSYAHSFGYASIETIATTPFLNLVTAAERARVRALLSSALTAGAAASVSASGEVSATVAVLRQDGSEDSLQLVFTPLEYHGKPCLQVSVRAAIGNADYQAAVERAASQDLLTRLDNRAHFHLRIESAIRKAVQTRVFSSLLVIELDEFIDISSAIGRSNANIVLNDIAAFLQDSIGKPFAAARLDAHEFGIIVYDGDPDEILALGKRIQSRLSEHISLALLNSLPLSCSIGMALINDHTSDAADVLARAHTNLRQNAMAHAANNEFSIDSQPAASAMLACLAGALEQQRFRLLYQPLVHLKGAAWHRYEVLARMLDSDGNEVAPGAFLQLANLNGMGESFDKLIVGKALDALSEASAVHSLIINLTSNTLASRTFLPWLSAQLRSSRMTADMLVLQISEIDIYNSPACSLEFCAGLHELNVQIAISHFGCALEPFAILQQVKPAFVALEVSTVRDIIYSAQQKQSIKALVSRVHAEGLQVVVPQVDDLDMLPVLWETGADFVQGSSLQSPSPELHYEFVQVEEITLAAAQH